MEEYIANEAILTKQNFLIKHKRNILFGLILVFVIETFVTIFYLKSLTALNGTPKEITPTAAVSTKQPPKEKIATLSIQPSQVTTKANQEFSVIVFVEPNGRFINGADAVILFNPEHLSVIDEDATSEGIQVSPGNLFNSLVVNSVNQEQGKIVLTASRLSKSIDPANESATLAKIRFLSLKKGKTDLKFLFDYAKTNTSNVTEYRTSDNILTNVFDAQVNITD